MIAVTVLIETTKLKADDIPNIVLPSEFLNFTWNKEKFYLPSEQKYT